METPLQQNAQQKGSMLDIKRGRRDTDVSECSAVYELADIAEKALSSYQSGCHVILTVDAKYLLIDI